MKLVKNIPAKIKNKSIRVDLEVYTRGGSDSPSLWLVWYQGKRRTPFWCDRNRLVFGMEASLRVLYSDNLEPLIYKTNPFIDLMKSQKSDYSFATISFKDILGTE